MSAPKVGSRHGRWTVLSEARRRETPSGTLKRYWHCLCDCGTSTEVNQAHLTSGRSQSCGCRKAELAAQQKHVHGASKTPIHEVWVQMLQRCKNPNNKSYPRYGGRGIRVCDAWHDFAQFQADMGPTYQPGLTLDRRENDGNYEVGNCRWVTNTVNCRNQSKTVFVEWQGEKISLCELGERFGVKKNTAYQRHRVKGWTVAQAIGAEPPPKTVRPPISETTRALMREAAIARHRRLRRVP